MDTPRRDVQVIEATVEEINAALLMLCQWVHELRAQLDALQREPRR